VKTKAQPSQLEEIMTSPANLLLKLAALLLAVMALAEAPRAARADANNCVLAYSPKTGRYGYGSATSILLATTEALQQCGDPNAPNVFFSHGNCAALARGSNGAWALAVGGSRKEAEQKALAACRKQAPDSYIVVSFSSY
jgi:hypothetical protein